VSGHLLENILVGRLRPGDVLPSEQALCSHFGVSRITVRKAMDELVERRLIVRRRGLGSFVSDPREAVKSVTLTGYIDEVLPRNQVDVLSEAWTVLPAAIREFVRLPDPKAQFKRFEAVNHVAEGEPLDCVSFYFPERVGLRLAANDIAGPLPPIKVLQARLGYRVDHADQLVEPLIAPLAIARRLGIRPGVAVLRALRAYYDPEGALLEVVDAIYHPRRYRYSATLYPRPAMTS